ncbi:MAG: hypothetical protein K2J26_05650, partial [Ruminococcus sp.]|nr:hypothetical protein [Ruminococcus sp.]
MLKKVLAGSAAVVMLVSLSPVMSIANNIRGGGTSATIPSTLRSNVTIDAYSGEVTLISPGAVTESVTTFRLNLTSLKEIEFTFCEDADEKFDMYDYSISDDSKDINIYVYKQDSLFDNENNSVVIGNVSNPVYVKAENVEYVSGNETIVLDNQSRTYIPQSVALDDDTDEDFNNEAAHQEDEYGLEAGDQFRNLSYSLLTTTAAATTKGTTTTTTAADTTTKRTWQSTTTETEPESVTTTTKATKPPKPTTTSTTTTSTTTSTSTTTTSTTEPTTTSTSTTTSTTTEPTTTSTSTTTTTTTTEKPTTTTTSTTTE